MARQSFTQLQATSKDYISQNAGNLASSSIGNFIKEHINKRYHLIQSKLKNWIVSDLPQTANTVASQQRYRYPENIYPPVVSATLTISSVAYPLIVVHNQRQWDQLNQISFSGTTIPQYILPLRDHFELWPIPAASGDTITLLGSMSDRDMTQEDYTTGTVTVTNDSATLTGSGTTWTAEMVGRWFQANTDQFWYRIGSFSSTTSLSLESAFQGNTAAGETYIIGEVPEIPPELHEIIPHGVAADFYSGPRKDFASAQAHNNYFWTGDFGNSSRNPRLAGGGLLEAIKRYSRRSTDKIIHKDLGQHNKFDERWSSTLTSTI